MSGFGYNVLGFGANASSAASLPSDDQFNRVSFLSHFDGANNGVNNAFDDSSSNNHTISNTGSPTQGSFGPFARPDGEWGVDFDSDGDYLTTPYSSDFNFGTGSFTIEAFVFLKDLSGIQGIYATSAGANPVPKWVMFLDDATPKIHINALNSSGSLYMNATTDLTVGTWNHIAYVRNGSTWYWFINGTQAGTGSNSTNITFSNSESTYIGLGGESYFSAINGFISNLRVVNGTALYTSSFTAPTSALTAVTNTKLLTCQSNRFVDNSASAHTITPSGNPAVTAFGAILTSKVYDAAINGGGSSPLDFATYLSIADGAWKTLGTGDFTWEWWFYGKTESVYMVGDATSSQNVSGTFTLGISSKRLTLYYSIQGGQAYLLQSPNSAPFYNLNEWHHIAYVRSGNDHKIYANGVLRATETRSGTMVDSTGALHIGNFGAGYASGSPTIFSDVRLVKGTAVYSGSTYTVPTAPLTAISGTELLVNFKDGQAIDSAAQNNLTLDGNTKISNGQAKFGDTSLLFDGTTDYAKTIFKTSFGAGNFTVEYFFRVGSVSTNQNLFQFGGSFLPSDDGGPGLGIRTSRWRLYTGANTATHHGSAGPSNNTWYHIAVVRNGTTTKLYVDGTETISVSDSYDYSPRKYLLLGGGFDGSYDMNGYMDEFRVSYMARYTSNFTAPTEPFADKGQ